MADRKRSKSTVTEPETSHLQEIDDVQTEDDIRRQDALREEQLQAFGATLYKKAMEQVQAKAPIEKRMLEDLRQYSGQYDPDVRKNFPDDGSDAFVNITRQKTNVTEARLSSMLFPSDDRNWSIKPTPVPEMPEQDIPAQYNDGSPVLDDDENPVTVGEQVQAEAKKRAEAMQDEIDDQLTESRYDVEARMVIHDGCVLGTGVLRGPETITNSKKSWKRLQDPETGEVGYEVMFEQDHRPSTFKVNPFDYFPDMSARSPKEAEFHYERIYFTKRDLIRLSTRPDFMVDQIRKVLQNPPSKVTASYITELRSISGLEGVREKKYEGWLYHGPVDKEDLIACGCDEDISDDPLEEYEAIVWMAEEVVIKAVINPIDTLEPPYSVFNLEKDDTSMFGFGVPRLMRNAQNIVNATWRMMLDNAALSVGPQIVINDKVITPAPNLDGSETWEITPLKLWKLKDKFADLDNIFRAFDIPSHQKEFESLFALARKLADEESGVPLIAQGEQSSEITKTAHGMELLMNSSNTAMRRPVKNWDDDVTEPHIGRYYDWNMQFNPKEEIKGDYKIDARGSSALLVKETQANNMLNLIKFANSPTLGPLTKWPETYRKLVNSMQIDPDEIVMTDEELEQHQKEQKPPQPSPDVVLKIQAESADKQKDREMEAVIANANLKSEDNRFFAKLALEKQTTVGKIIEDVQFKREQIKLGNRKEKNKERELMYKAVSGRMGI